MTGVKFERQGLDEALTYVRLGDTFVVWKLDRLGRSLKDLIEMLDLLQEPKAWSGFRAIASKMNNLFAIVQIF